MVTTVIIKLPRNGHPSAVRCSLFRIRSGIGLRHAMHACCSYHLWKVAIKAFQTRVKNVRAYRCWAYVFPLSGWRCMWVDNRSKGVLGTSGKSRVNVISSSIRRSVQAGKRSAVGRRWILGVGPTSFLRRGDVKCSRAKGREKVLNGIGNVGKKSAHSRANVFFTSTGGR